MDYQNIQYRSPNQSNRIILPPNQIDNSVITHYNSSASKLVGLLQLSFALLAIFANTVIIAVLNNRSPTDDNNYEMWGFPAFVGSAYWCGIIFMTCAFIGLLSSRNKQKTLVIAYLIMSIISAAFSTVVVSMGIIGLSVVGPDSMDRETRHITNSTRTYDYFSKNENYDIVMAMYSIMLLSAIIEGILGIISSSFCCSAICCRNNIRISGDIIYNYVQQLQSDSRA
ncbi:DgyrCDS13232 [Dimorphilus gyrociliatus]|uniref:DgyrCDS13232 n=1 Tax=Dimorphilus gyrociliatus TaxID=2664684 RepID=A0A7I8WA43_9ANNE|nr:DgyrCDS13232 [Dimorphilus gyrociliatus]